MKQQGDEQQQLESPSKRYTRTRRMEAGDFDKV